MPYGLLLSRRRPLPSTRRRSAPPFAGRLSLTLPSRAPLLRFFPATMMSFFRAKQLGPPLARWGAAAGTIGFFLLYEEVPQLILQTQYGIFPGYTDVAIAFGFMKGPAPAEE